MSFYNNFDREWTADGSSKRKAGNALHARTSWFALFAQLQVLHQYCETREGVHVQLITGVTIYTHQLVIATTWVIVSSPLRKLSVIISYTSQNLTATETSKLLVFWNVCSREKVLLLLKWVPNINDKISCVHRYRWFEVWGKCLCRFLLQRETTALSTKFPHARRHTYVSSNPHHRWPVEGIDVNLQQIDMVRFMSAKHSRSF